MTDNLSPIPGVKAVFFGRAGSGKTYSTRTLFNVKGLIPVHLFLESSQSTISDIPEAQWTHLSPFRGKNNTETLAAMFEKINILSNDDLQRTGGLSTKRDMRQMLELIELLNNFKTHDGKELGDVQKWGTDKVLVMDGLTDLTRMARYIQSGLKPLLTQPDYGAIMFSIEVLLKYLTEELWCHFILISHIEIEKDEIGGGYQKSLSTIGRKLAPIIPPMFDDVILAKKIDGTFTWSSVENDADTKNRTMPLHDSMEQDFEILFRMWQERGGILSPAIPGGGE